MPTFEDCAVFGWMFFSRDVPALASQIGAVLVVAFIVEFRAVADGRSMEKSTALVILWIVFRSPDADESHAAADSSEQHLRQPGWKWFFRGSREPLHSSVRMIAER